MSDYNNGTLPDPCLRLDYGFGEQWASVELGDGTGYVRLADYESVQAENAKLRELFEKTYGYYVSGTLTPCDFCKRLDCEGNAPTTCEADEYDPDGIVNNEIERLMRELGVRLDR